MKFRKRVFRSFQAWYSTNQANFRRKLSVIERSESRLVLAVDGIPKQVMTILFEICYGKSRSLNVAANFHLNGECLDSAGWFDAAPLRVAEGYRCSLCEDRSSSTVYPSIEALWVEHVFVPWMIWINEALTSLSRIDFCQKPDGGTSWVNFIQDEAIRKADEAIASFSIQGTATLKGSVGNVDVST